MEVGHPLLRVQKGPGKPFLDEGGEVKEPALVIPQGSVLFAGSVLFLDPDTEYDLKLTLKGPEWTPVERF